MCPWWLFCILRRCDMSKPEVAEYVTPRFYMISYPFLLLQELGEANTLQDNKLLWLLFSLLYLLRLNYCSFVHETATFEGYAKRFSAARESCVHAIAFRVTTVYPQLIHGTSRIISFYDSCFHYCIYFVWIIVPLFMRLPHLRATQNGFPPRGKAVCMLSLSELLQSIHNWSTVLAGAQCSYNLDMSQSTAQPWVLGWMSHDHTCTSGDHRLPVTRQSHIIVEIGGKFERASATKLQTASRRFLPTPVWTFSPETLSR